MPTFTHAEVTPDEATLELVYQLGIDSQLPHGIGCSPYPYPPMREVRAALENESLHRYLIYADGVLRMAIAFDDEGVIQFCISKPWLTLAQISAGQTHPNGLAQAAYSYDLVRSFSGGVVKSFNTSQEPSILALHEANDVIVVESSD